MARRVNPKARLELERLEDRSLMANSILGGINVPPMVIPNFTPRQGDFSSFDLSPQADQSLAIVPLEMPRGAINRLERVAAVFALQQVVPGQLRRRPLGSLSPSGPIVSWL